MSATVFVIKGRQREHANQFASVADFSLETEASIDVQSVLEDPLSTLYCLDLAQQRAIFVKTSPSVDLYDAPFLYQAQFQHAERVITVALSDLLAASENDSTAAPDVAFLYSVGRCGSTLLGRALHAIPEVICIAEPEAPIGCALAPAIAEQPELLRACIRWQCKPGTTKRASRYVIKLRHVGIKLGVQLQRVFPDSRALFVYRNAADFVQSSLRAFHPLPPSFRAYHEDPIRFTAGQWLSVMKQYLSLQRSGATVRAVRYEDLNRAPQQIFAAICSFYGLAADRAKTDEILAVDSQAGSNLARENLAHKSILELGSPAVIEQKVRDFLVPHVELDRPDVIVPGMLIEDL